MRSADLGNGTRVLPRGLAASAGLVTQPQSSISHLSSMSPSRLSPRRTLAPPFPRLQARFPGSSPELTLNFYTVPKSRSALPWQPYAAPPSLYACRELTDSAAAAWAPPPPHLDRITNGWLTCSTRVMSPKRTAGAGEQAVGCPG